MTDSFAALVQSWDEILAAIGGLVVALQLLIGAFLGLAKLLKVLALWTATKRDDEALERLALTLARVHDWLERVQRKIPRPRTGKVRAPLVGTTIPPPRPPPPEANAS